MQEWLRASGRLDGMREEDYVFAPLAEPMREEDHSVPEAWVKGRYLSSSQILGCLKLYGRRVGIPEEKLNLMALRRTATRLRLEEGSSTEEMQTFLGSREEARFTKSRLRRLPALPATQAAGGGGLSAFAASPLSLRGHPVSMRCQETRSPGIDAIPGETRLAACLPVRKPRPFRAGEGVIHGLFAARQPPEAVRALMAENIRGLREEIRGLRELEGGLLELQMAARKSAEAAQLANAYTLTAARLAVLIEADKKQAETQKEDSSAEEFLEILDNVAAEKGEPPVSPKVREEARQWGRGPEAADGRLTEEIAATRYILRNTLSRAKEAEEKGEGREYIHMAEIYSIGCNRLVRLLKAEGDDPGQLGAYVWAVFEKAIDQVVEEWGLAKNEEAPDEAGCGNM
jgi:hypothetical protein